MKLRQPTDVEKDAIRKLADWACGKLGYYPGECFGIAQAFVNEAIPAGENKYHPRFIELVGKGHAFNSHSFQHLLCDLLDPEM